MRKSFKVVGIWVVSLFVLIVILDLVQLIPGMISINEEGIPQALSLSSYIGRFLIEAFIYSVVGVLAGLCFRRVEESGLFALSVSLGYIAYVESNGALWYYIASHPNVVDQFFFTAPILAPIVFIVGGCLIWRMFFREIPNNAL